MEGRLIVAAAVLAIVAAGFVIWLVPRLQVARWRRAGIEEEKLAELGVQARSAITQAIGGLALIITIALTAAQATEARRSADETEETAAKNLEIAKAQVELAKAQVKLAQEGQVAERFSQAVERLGAMTGKKAAVDVRTGALFSLRQVGLRLESYTEPVVRLAAAYVRNNFNPPDRVAAHGCRAEFGRLGADIEIALRAVLPAVAGKLRGRSHQQPNIGLRGAEFDGLAMDGVVLMHLNLTGIKFNHSSLIRANFSNSILRGAGFERACLRGARFRGADLRGEANFRGADLRGADFRRATLRGVDFEGANLSGATFEGALFTKADCKRLRSAVPAPTLRGAQCGL